VPAVSSVEGFAVYRYAKLAVFFPENRRKIIARLFIAFLSVPTGARELEAPKYNFEASITGVWGRRVRGPFRRL